MNTYRLEVFFGKYLNEKKIHVTPFMNWKKTTESTFFSAINPLEKSLDVLPKEHFYFYLNIPALKGNSKKKGMTINLFQIKFRYGY